MNVNKRISFDAGVSLFDKDIFSLAREASDMRVSKHPEKIVTYIVDRNINYTNICSSGCKFCAFYRDKSSSEGYVLSDDK
ncbi:dehypoxanthine futalosine cyclase, partial [bacterium]|nr:dehypoxanthine futalosine cyclase [bacterium]